MKKMQVLMLAGVLFMYAPQVLSQSETINEGAIKVSYVNVQNEVTESRYLSYYTPQRDYSTRDVNGRTEVTFYYANGKVQERGYLKEGLLQGEWIRYNEAGEKVQIANYENGQKMGRWFFWLQDGERLRVMDYRANELIKTQDWHIAKNEMLAES